jgi:hypothetical protein
MGFFSNRAENGLLYVLGCVKGFSSLVRSIFELPPTEHLFSVQITLVIGTNRVVTRTFVLTIGYCE